MRRSGRCPGQRQPVDDRLVKVDDGNDVLAGTRSRLAMLVFFPPGFEVVDHGVIAGVVNICRRSTSCWVSMSFSFGRLNTSLFSPMCKRTCHRAAAPSIEWSTTTRSRRAIRRCGLSGAERSAAGCLDDGRRCARALAATTGDPLVVVDDLNVARVAVAPHTCHLGVAQAPSAALRRPARRRLERQQ